MPSLSDRGYVLLLVRSRHIGLYHLFRLWKQDPMAYAVYDEGVRNVTEKTAGVGSDTEGDPDHIGRGYTSRTSYTCPHCSGIYDVYGWDVPGVKKKEKCQGCSKEVEVIPQKLGSYPDYDPPIS